MNRKSAASLSAAPATDGRAGVGAEGDEAVDGIEGRGDNAVLLRCSAKRPLVSISNNSNALGCASFLYRKPENDVIHDLVEELTGWEFSHKWRFRHASASDYCIVAVFMLRWLWEYLQRWRA